jgi:hypothetical protein
LLKYQLVFQPLVDISKSSKALLTSTLRPHPAVSPASFSTLLSIHTYDISSYHPRMLEMVLSRYL